MRLKIFFLHHFLDKLSCGRNDNLVDCENSKVYNSQRVIKIKRNQNGNYPEWLKPEEKLVECLERPGKVMQRNKVF